MKFAFIILPILGIAGWYFLNQNPEPLIQTKKNELVISPNQEAKINPKYVPIVQIKNIETRKTKKIAPTESAKNKDEGLSATYMKKRMENYREQFLNCQKNTLRKNKFVVGHILIGFSVNPLGSTENLKILNSQLSHKDMESCILGVFARAKFKRFKGQNIYFSYPLSFE